ncbi:serine carboxypeptidase S28, putative [Eimeria acervulina]|uniref:Serine carboxypeptidase S28, putative n=1 Tax=Eimeria acervulina TaxID=5801 RepID=U6H0L7_EIMAC|nr:serine carboxypeptidase S28, putative [Eimeria acervulina]CDI84309.1 serine carboxypeptidase S28, putative [Eimeria acervulina]
MQVSRTGCVQVLLLLLLLQLLLLQLQQAAATKWFLFGRPQGSAADSCNRSGEEIHLEAQWFEQPLDHFDPILQAEGRKWKQRYFELLHQDPQQQQQQQQQQQGNQLPRPMFVYIGGEAAIAPTDITGGRALADLAAFIEAKRRERAKAQKVSPSHIPVVVFGCSYPGSLAAFARLKYPFLISGAISSSSPLQAKESFFAFDAAVKAGLPPRCAAAAAAGLAALSSRMQDTTLAEQELHRFGCEDVPIQTNTEKTAFVYSVVDAVAEAVQYNRPTERPLVESLCSSLGFVAADVPPDSSSSSNSSSSSSSSSSRIKPKMSSAHVVEYEEEEEREKKEKKEAGVVFREETRDRDRDRDRDREEHLLQGLAKYFKESYSRKQTNCRSLNMLAATDTRLDNSVLSNTRLWMWQSCSQFGFWQVR